MVMRTATRARPLQLSSGRAVQLRAMIKQLELQRVSLCARMRLIEQEIQLLQAAPEPKLPK